MNTTPQKTIGVLLAAGMGTRLGFLTKNIPKALVTVYGAPLLSYAVQYLRRVGVHEIKIIGGFGFEDVKKIVEKKYPTVKLYENKDYKKGNLYTLDVMLPFINESFLLMNVDHIYHKAISHKVREQFRDAIIAFTDNDRTLTDDDMKVYTSSDGKYIKHISKTLTEYHRGYVGKTFCHKNKLSLYKDAVERAKKKYGDAAVVEHVLQIIADDTPQTVEVGDISGSQWLEVDLPHERDRAEEEVHNNKTDFYDESI